MAAGSPPPLVLASSSPRRARVLEMLGLDFEVRPAGVRETALEGEEPRAHAERLARDKARVVHGERPGALVVAGDTVVVLDGEVLGKPGDEEAAVRMLLGLSGRGHTVMTGVALGAPDGVIRSGVSETRVDFRAFGDDEARAYADTGEPLDKAGGYGIQGRGSALVKRVSGDFYSVVGLPVALLLDLLQEAGWRYAFGTLLPRGGDRA